MEEKEDNEKTLAEIVAEAKQIGIPINEYLLIPEEIREQLKLLYELKKSIVELREVYTKTAMEMRSGKIWSIVALTAAFIALIIRVAPIFS